MLFSVIISATIVIICFLIDINISDVTNIFDEHFQVKIFTDKLYFNNATPETLQAFCPEVINSLTTLETKLDDFIIFSMLSGIGYFTAVLQDLSIIKLLNNVQLNLTSITVQFSIFIVSLLFLICSIDSVGNPVLTDGCTGYVNITGEQKAKIDKMFSMLVGTNESLEFNFLISATVFLYSLIMVYKLKGLQQLGELIIMVGFMISELRQFLVTFGLILVLFIIVGR